jgi:hypothetical protein
MNRKVVVLRHLDDFTQQRFKSPHELPARVRIEPCRLAVAKYSRGLEPIQEFRGGPQMKEFSRGNGVMKAGRLIIQHDVVGARNSHEVIAARRGKQQEKIVGGILIGRRVIGVADVAAHAACP